MNRYKILIIAILLISCNMKTKNETCINEIYFEFAKAVEPDYIKIKILNSRFKINDALKSENFKEIIIQGKIINQKHMHNVYNNGIDNNILFVALPTFDYIKYTKSILDEDLKNSTVRIVLKDSTIVIIPHCP